MRKLFGAIFILLSSGIAVWYPIIKLFRRIMSKAKRYNPETNIKSLELGRANILYIF